MLFFDEFNCRRIDAIPLICRRRPVIENMAEMCVAPRAEHLRTKHPEAVIRLFADVQIGNRLIVAGPAGAGVKFHFVGE